MDNTYELTLNENALKLAFIEIKLCVNQRLYQKGVLTEEMYLRANELIIKNENEATYRN